MEFIKFCFETSPILATLLVLLVLGVYIRCLFYDTMKEKVCAVVAWTLFFVGYTWILTSDFFLIILFVMFICYPVLRIFGGAILDLFRYFFRL